MQSRLTREVPAIICEQSDAVPQRGGTDQKIEVADRCSGLF